MQTKEVDYTDLDSDKGYAKRILADQVEPSFVTY